MGTPIVTLTTDFGMDSGYVGAMKGVLLGIAPQLTIVDISHEIPATDIAHGAFVLANASPYYVPSTIHMAVVDPGVGTERLALLVSTPTGLFLAPDNGILSYVLMPHIAYTTNPEISPFGTFRMSIGKNCMAFKINNPNLLCHDVSYTFHGRDIFAPIAAQLANGLKISSVGEQVDVVTMLNLPTIPACQQSIKGFVIFVDHFGNLVTNLTGDTVNGKRITLDILGESISGLNSSYQSGREELLLIIGSHGYLEIARRNGSAASTLGAKVGTEVLVTLPDRSFHYKLT